jgi:hypothetical protein
VVEQFLVMEGVVALGLTRASSNNRVISEASVNRVKKAESVASRKTGGDV